MLYVLSTVFVAYLSFRQILDPATWNALFWIILLFASVNAAARSFMQESSSRHLYYYMLVSPQELILSKIIYNMLMVLILAFIEYFFYTLFIGNIIQDHFSFVIALLLGSMGFSSLLTMISAIASKAGQNPALVAILAFPVLIPLLISSIRFSRDAIFGLALSANTGGVVILLALNVIVVMLAYILFPYIWRN